MKLHILFVLLSLGYTNWALAEIYKSVDAEGHVTYSSTPSRGAKKLGLERPYQPSPSPSRKTYSHTERAGDNASPADFPKVAKETQKSRDSARRKILSDELATEENLLIEARANLKQGEASRIDEKSEGKLHSLNEEVTLHERNISALKTELSNVK